MDKVAAGQLRLVPIDIRYGSEWVKAGTPYLVLGRPETDSSIITWHCLLAGRTVCWHESDIKKDRLA